MSRPIEIEGLSKSFGQTRAVDDLSFTVGEGKVVGFLGPNGSGKTTTLRALLGLIRPDAGTLTIEGRRFVELPAPATTVGAVLEADGAHPGRSGRNHLRALALAGGIDPGRVDPLLEQVGLADAARRRVKGYSLGMKQRLGIAAALLGEPRVLILDEPANGLDPAGIRWLRDLLRGLADQGSSVLVSSHVLAEIANTADEVVVINRGRSIIQAPVAELVARGGGGWKVASPQMDRLVEALRGSGAEVEAIEPDAAVVKDRTGEEIGALALAAGIALSELSPTEGSLEDVFLRLIAEEDE